MDSNSETYKREKDIKISSYQNLVVLFNSRIVCWVGAYVDPGLPRDQFHAIPWNVEKKVSVKIREDAARWKVKIFAPKGIN